MVVENKGQQQSVRFVVDTDRCCGCRKCIRRCMENVWQWDNEHHHAYQNIRMNVYCVISVKWSV